MTCMPDTAAMIIADKGMTCTAYEARNVCMPDWRHSNKLPCMKTITAFYNSKGLKVKPRGELDSNPHALFRQTEGVFHLVFVLSTEEGERSRRPVNKSGEGLRHAAVYNAYQSVLKDNQQDTPPLFIEDTDKANKKASRRAVLSFWPGVVL